MVGLCLCLIVAYFITRLEAARWQVPKKQSGLHSKTANDQLMYFFISIDKKICKHRNIGSRNLGSFVKVLKCGQQEVRLAPVGVDRRGDGGRGRPVAVMAGGEEPQSGY